MNPHSLLSDEIFGIGRSPQRAQRAKRGGEPGRKDRVTACRKRVRVNRTMHKTASVRNQADEIFPEPDSAASPSRQYTEEYRPAVAGRLVEGQEVGIT